MIRPAFIFGLCALFILIPQTASAHLVNTRFGDFYDGMLHPLTAFEHMMPWLALGLLAGSQPKAGRWILLAFPVGLMLGIALSYPLPGLSFISTVNLSSFIVIGALVALAMPLPPLVLALVACIFGMSHGYANGTAMTEATNVVLFTPGVATVGYLVVLLIAAGVALVSTKWSAARIAVRAAGSWILAIGLMMLGTSSVWGS